MLRLGCRMGHSQRDGQYGIGTEVRLVLRTIEREHRRINRILIGRIEADERRSNFLIDIGYRLRHALAAELLRIVVTQLERLELARRGS